MAWLAGRAVSPGCRRGQWRRRCGCGRPAAWRRGWVSVRTRWRGIWADHNLKPWKVETFKVSNDPQFEDKLVDVVGLYLNPPVRAAVFSFDEKTPCQALDRTQPSLPMKPGRAGTTTHDYKRNGTIDLFAAMNIATGQVLTEFRKTHKGGDVLRFFKQIDDAVPRAECACRAGQPVRAQRAGGDQVVGAQGPQTLAPAFHADLQFPG